MLGGLPPLLCSGDFAPFLTLLGDFPPYPTMLFAIDFFAFFYGSFLGFYEDTQHCRVNSSSYLFCGPMLEARRGGD